MQINLKEYVSFQVKFDNDSEKYPYHKYFRFLHRSILHFFFFLVLQVSERPANLALDMPGVQIKGSPRKASFSGGKVTFVLGELAFLTHEKLLCTSTDPYIYFYLCLIKDGARCLENFLVINTLSFKIFVVKLFKTLKSLDSCVV